MKEDNDKQETKLPPPKYYYAQHPVSPERKRELRDQGFTIVDKIYAPEGTPKDRIDADPTDKPATKQAAK